MVEAPFHWPGQRDKDPAHERVAAFLVMDIQHSPQWAEELVKQVDAVASGTLPKWERIGNAFRLELSVDGAFIEDLVDETSPAHSVPLDEFRAAVSAWNAHL
jgi:hypothetical protein